MHIDRALKVRDAQRTRIADLYSSARLYGYSSEEINAGVAAIRADAPKGTPGWVWSYLDGFRYALIQELYAAHLIHGGFVNGQFYSTHRKRPDYYAASGIDPVDFADDGTVERRGHYWDRYVPIQGGTYDRGGFKPFYVG